MAARRAGPGARRSRRQPWWAMCSPAGSPTTTRRSRGAAGHRAGAARRTRAHEFSAGRRRRILAAQLRGARATPPSSSSRWPARACTSRRSVSATSIELFPLDARQHHRSGRIQPPHGRTGRRAARFHPGSLPAPVRARPGEFWAASRAAAPRRRAWRDKLDLYAANGRINLLDHESFEETDWAWLLLGSGCSAAGHRTADPPASRKARRRSEVDALRTHVQQVADSMPRHIDFVRHQASSAARAGAAEDQMQRKVRKDRDRRRRHRRMDGRGGVRANVEGCAAIRSSSSNPRRSAPWASARPPFRRSSISTASMKIDENEFMRATQASIQARHRVRGLDAARAHRTSIPSATTACRCTASTSTISGCATARRAERCRPMRSTSNIIACARRARFGKPRPDDRMPLPPHGLRLSLRCRPVRAVSAPNGRSRWRETHRRQGRRRAAERRGRLHRVGQARRRARRRGRPVHRLLRIPRTAHRADAACRLRGLEPVAALRPRHGRALRARRRDDAVHALDRRARPAGSGAFRCSTAPATATCTAASSSATTKRRACC